MDSKENEPESSANNLKAWENTEIDSAATFVAEKSSEIENKVELEMEVESDKKELTSKAVSVEKIDKIQINYSEAADVAICPVIVKSEEIKNASSSVDLKADANKTETSNSSVLTMENGPTTNCDVDLVPMVNADSGTASNPGTLTDITIDADGSLDQKVNNDFQEIIGVDEYNSATKNNPNPVQLEPSERNKLGKRKQSDNEVIVISSGSDTDLPTTSKGLKTKQARTDPAEEKKRLIQLIRSYPVLYDPKHSDVKTIGSKKAAYMEIGNEIGLTRTFSLNVLNYTYKLLYSFPFIRQTSQHAMV